MEQGGEPVLLHQSLPELHECRVVDAGHRLQVPVAAANDLLVHQPLEHADFVVALSSDVGPPQGHPQDIPNSLVVQPGKSCIAWYAF